MTARSLRRALLTCVAALAIVAPTAGAAAFGTPGASGVPSSYYGIDASSLHTASGTTDADIDAVPGLRAQLNDKAAREAQAADAATPTVRVQRGTTDADIDAVPGLRAQLQRQGGARGRPGRGRDDGRARPTPPTASSGAMRRSARRSPSPSSGPARSWRSASAAARAGRPASRSTLARRSRVGTTAGPRPQRLIRRPRPRWPASDAGRWWRQVSA